MMSRAVRRVLLIITLLAPLFVGRPVAAEDRLPPIEVGTDKGQSTKDEATAIVLEQGGGTSGGKKPSVSPPQPGEDPGDRPPPPAFVIGADGQLCYTGRPLPGVAAPGEDLLVGATPCAGNDVAAPPTPLEAATYAWRHLVDLPVPAFTAQPAIAITGRSTFLTLTDPQSVHTSVAALGYTVTLDISSTNDVAWGDGATTARHAGAGGAYPDGDLTHVYIDRGTVTVGVAQRWTCTWHAGGQGGVIADRLVTRTTGPLTIQEIQAVITG